MSRILNDLETEITHLKKQPDRKCSQCGQLWCYYDLVEIDYLDYLLSPEYMTPAGRKTEIVCRDCLTEYY